jgi:hypothetical protein
MTGQEQLQELTTSGEGYIHPIDPVMDREPAGALLLARAAAIRNATQAALRQVAAPLAAAIGPSAADAIERELVPRSYEFVHHRQVIAESRTDPSDKGAQYRVEVVVAIDLRALQAELVRHRR